MIRSKLGFRYARTLILLLRTEEEVREVRQQLRDVREALAEPSLREFIENPAISTHRKERALLEVLEAAGVNETLAQFLRLVALKGRLTHIDEIVDEFEALARERLGEKVVYVESAYPLTQDERDALVAALEGRLKKRVILRETVDPQLIAGVKIRIGDTVSDGSLNRVLEAMQEELEKA